MIVVFIILTIKSISVLINVQKISFMLLIIQNHIVLFNVNFIGFNLIKLKNNALKVIHVRELLMKKM